MRATKGLILKWLLKKTFEPTKENPNMEENLLNSTRRFTFMENLLQNFVITNKYFCFYSHICSLGLIYFFSQKTISPSFNKTGKLQVFALYLLKYLCLEYAQHEYPSKECCQGINYTIN